MLLKIILMIFGSSQAHFIHLSDRSIDQCANHREQCNPFLDSPCCKASETCTLVPWNENLFACLRTIKLGTPCLSDSFCSDSDSVICSPHENVCKCSNNYMSITEHECAPLLGGFCRENFDCIVSNSVCNNHKCVCKPSYVSHSNNACLLTPLGKVCEDDMDCLSTSNVICSESGVCKCRESYEEIRNAVCASFLGGYCNNYSECWPDNSVCFDNKCQCQYGFIRVSEKECRSTPLGNPCILDDDCNDDYLGLKSTEKKFICKAHGPPEYTFRCSSLLGEICTLQEHCLIDNSRCIGNTCRCKYGFMPKNNRECKPILLNKSCGSNHDCGNDGNLICSNDKKCVCAQGYVEVNNQTCIGALSTFCSDTIPC